MKLTVLLFKEYFLEAFSSHTNRSKNQTLELFELVDCDFFTLIELEEKIKNNLISYCPACKESISKILALPSSIRTCSKNFNITPKFYCK